MDRVLKNGILNFRVKKFINLGLTSMEKPGYSEIEQIIRSKESIQITKNLLNSLVVQLCY